MTAMKKLVGGIESERTNSNRGENPRRHLPGKFTLALLFIILMMPLNHVLRKCTGCCYFIKAQEKFNEFTLIDSIKVHGKK